MHDIATFAVAAITQNWRGRPLADHVTIIDLFATTTATTGLKVEAVLDTTVCFELLFNPAGESLVSAP
jgi:hypothetical protein